MSNSDHVEVGSCPVCGNLCQVIETEKTKEFKNLQVPSAEVQDAVEAILMALNIPSYARPYSTETVIYKDAIPVIQQLRARNEKLGEAIKKAAIDAIVGVMGK